MTTKTISGTYSAGYLLSSSFNAVTITAAGSVGGFGLVTNGFAAVTNDGHLLAANGANGLTLGAGGGSLNNQSAGYLHGGLAIASSGAGAAGKAGGAGAYMTVYGSITGNTGRIVGGNGGAGVTGSIAGVGGVGGSGATFHAGGFVENNGGIVLGGTGGVGGAGQFINPLSAGKGGAGGSGVAMAAYGQVFEGSGSVTGGAGGKGGFSYGFAATGGAGGAGVSFAAAGYVYIAGGTVGGGIGGAGGNSDGSESASAGYGGVGGVGVQFGGVGVLINNGLVQGGQGGAGGAGKAPGYGGGGGTGGVGLVMNGGGVSINYGEILGGHGGVAGTGPRGSGGDGGLGAIVGAGGTIFNEGAIIGGYGAAGFISGEAGGGVTLTAGGEVVNGSSSNRAALIEAGGASVDPVGYAITDSYGAPVTVVNFGTIASQGNGDAVFLANAADTLVVEQNCVFTGEVFGSLSVLELGSGTGTLAAFQDNGVDQTVSGSMAATTFRDFGTVQVDAGAAFTLAGATDVLVNSFVSDVLIDNGSLTVSSSLSVEGALEVGGSLGGGKTASLVVDGGTATFDAGASLGVGQVTLSSGTVAVLGTLSYAGGWTQSGGTLSLQQGAYLTLTGRNLSFSGLMDETGGGTADIVFAPTKASKDTMNDLTIDELRLNAVNTTFVIGAGGVTITDTAGLGLDGVGAAITGAKTKATLTNDGGLEGTGAIGEGKMGLINNGIIQSEDLDAPISALVIDTGKGKDINNNSIIADSEGGLTIVSALTNHGLLVVEMGTLTLSGAVTGSHGSGQVAGGLFDAAGAFNQAVSFTGATGTLELAHGQAYTATITGFAHGGGTYLDLDDIQFVSAGEAVYAGTASGGTLTVSDGMHTATIVFSGNYLGSRFTCASDGHNGTIIHTFLPAAVPPSTAPAPAPVAPPHALVAAMAGLGGSAGAHAAAQRAPLSHEPMAGRLVAPRTAVA